MEEEKLRELAAQFRCPHGEKGVVVGNAMNESNVLMTENALVNLHLQDNDNVLELGHGNCGHLQRVLSKANNLAYTGLEISELMREEAERINPPESNRHARFLLFDGVNIPLRDNSFDKIFTVNTVYFWDDPKRLFSEIGRVLKPSGIFCLTFFSKESMQDIPFAQYGFNHVEHREIEYFLQDGSLFISSVDKQTDCIVSKKGKQTLRTFYTYVMNKFVNF